VRLYAADPIARGFQDAVARAEGGASAAEEAQEGEEHGEHRHHLSLLLGATSYLEENETSFTLGVDYERRLSPRWGAGLFGEVVFADETETLLGVSGIYHATRQLELVAGVGLEFADGESELLLRLGAVYLWEKRGYSLGPFLFWDTVSGDSSLVYGVSVGKGF
jgi:hypothetical protein